MDTASKTMHQMLQCRECKLNFTAPFHLVQELLYKKPINRDAEIFHLFKNGSNIQDVCSKFNITIRYAIETIHKHKRKHKIIDADVREYDEVINMYNVRDYMEIPSKNIKEY